MVLGTSWQGWERGSRLHLSMEWNESMGGMEPKVDDLGVWMN